MTRVRTTSETQQARTAPRAVRAGLRPLLLSAAAALLCLAFAPAAQADLGICTSGTAAGKCESPQGLATDFESGRLYVADKGNNRIDVFEANGAFVMAFGWGVDTGAAKPETCTTASTCQAGIAGSGEGQFDHPTSVAVDNTGSASHHDLYVGADSFRVQKFEPNGAFVKAFGTQGKAECQIANAADPVAVGPNGNVYLGDSYRIGPAESEGSVNRLERFDQEGNCLGEVTLLFEDPVAKIVQLAVDSGGDFYLAPSAGGKLLKYSPAGVLLYELGVTESENLTSYATQAEGLAVDGADDVFTQQRGPSLTNRSSESTYFFTEYDSSGAILRRFGYTGGPFFISVQGLAAFHSPSGDLFSAWKKGNNLPGEVSYLSFPPPGPLIFPAACKVKQNGNVKPTLVAEVNPEGKATTVHFEYVSEAHFQAEGFANPETTEESASIGEDFNLQEALGQASTEPETEYRCRVVASNADGSRTGEEGSFTTLAPLEFGPTTVSDVGPEEATLNAQVNPLGIETKGFFEYVEEATYLKDVEELGPEHGFDHAAKAPAGEPIDFGAKEGFVSGSATVSGLAPATSYRFRLVASNAFPPFSFNGPTAYLHTFGSSSEALPDGRAWELVSPGQKNSADVAVPGNAGGFSEDRTIRIEAGATSGEAVTYTSFISFGQAEGAPAANQYLSKRTPGGWSTENISPLGVSSPVSPPYTGFSADLDFGAFRTIAPPLAPGCPEGFRNFYLRDNTTGTTRCLSTEAPQGIAGSCFTYAGSSADGTRSFFAVDTSYGGAPQGSGFFHFSLYESSAEKGLVALSVLPGQSEAVAPTKKTSFGEGNGNCQQGLTPMRHVISADGSKAFWTYVPEEGETQPSRLLVRVDGKETIQLDADQGGSDKAGGNGVFKAASTDGSVAYFTDTARLVKGSKAEAGAPELYRYELGRGEPLTDLTKAALPANVQGLAGISDDGSYVYFVAEGVLSAEANDRGDKAQEGKPNLYLYHAGKTSFIGTLDPADEGTWDSQPRTLSARVSPDGRHLAFLSLEAKGLVGYENTIAGDGVSGGPHCRWDQLEKKFFGTPLCAQAFLYDAETGDLSCASCNPSGSRPLGPTLLPGWTNVYEGPRYLSDSGSRLFFESYDALSSADQNAKRDVYEFERPGTGGCSSESPAFDPLSGGCHFLISSGKSSDESYLVDASADGRDAFLSTRGALTGWDANDNFDVYDARVGGGFAEPSEAEICSGEACKPPPAAPPSGSSPTTPAVQGSGNPVQRHKKHKKKRHKAKHKHARAHHGKRTPR